MEAPVSIDSEEDESDESICILPEDLEDEVDINIHFHCEHCINLTKCNERAKPGWCCDVIECNNGCGKKFHICKLDEHELLCSHARVPCINSGNGCPHIIQRQYISAHLPTCPASIVVCNAEWNRWAFGSRERERISMAKGATANYEIDDLDMCLAIDDQRLVNEMHLQPKYLRKIMCNGMTKRFPSLPLSIRGSLRDDSEIDSHKKRARSQSTTDDEEEGLTPGLSLSVCTELLRGKIINKEGSSNIAQNDNSFSLDPMLISSLSLNPAWSDSASSKKAQTRNDDISAFCCTHGILKDLCNFCRDDPDEPDFKFGNVWREQPVNLGRPGLISWKREPRVEKIRKRNPFGIFTYKHFDESDEEDEEEREGGEKKNHGDATAMAIDSEGRPLGRFRLQTPPPAQLTPKGLSLEIVLKHYSRHQVKPKSMFTFQCMKEMRRDEFVHHYKNVHSEIQEGLEGWMMERCPLHVIGCPFSLRRLAPISQDREVVFCHTQRAFGIKPNCKNIENGHSRSPSLEKSQKRTLGGKTMRSIPEHPPLHKKETQFMASSGHITFLPVEVLQSIARYLDGFSLNNLSLTCSFMRSICFSLLDEKGLVIQEWVRTCDGSKVSWKLGRNKWFFPKSFEHVHNWTFLGGESMSNHLAVCPFNDRLLSQEKFCYSHLRKEEIKRFSKPAQL